MTTPQDKEPGGHANGLGCPACQALRNENLTLRKRVGELEAELHRVNVHGDGTPSPPIGTQHTKRWASDASLDTQHTTPPPGPRTTQTQLIHVKGDDLMIVQDDPYLKPFVSSIESRMRRFYGLKQRIEDAEGSLDKFSQGFKEYGFHREAGGVFYKEWAPAAQAASLAGDFNGWNRYTHPMHRDEFGRWSVFVPDHPNGTPAILHGTKVKISLQLSNGEWVDRIPAWIRRVMQEAGDPCYHAIYWNPPKPYAWKNPPPPKVPEGLRIYEAHVGICTPEPKIASYNEFTQQILPHVRDLGYNCIQLMAIMEHAYYASFGYHVTNFFAISSRFGTPEELMELIDTAHGMGIHVIMDVIHSHASTNVLDGLNRFDGTDHMYFHEGGKGYHDLWDSRLFNYGHWEVLRFLLSNLRFYMEEYRFDGFRFDGVSSMLYVHHGIGTGFAGGYDSYFGGAMDEESAVYLMLANDLLHTVYPRVVTIAEEVSGMPALCRCVEEGGFGFDYRMGMAIPDKWIELLKHKKDEEWNMGEIVFTLTNRRWKEKTVAYSECHDQALVGDKTIAFWLMDKEMYTQMTMLVSSPVIDRGLSLHMMIRLITYALGGEAYLNFMGNEFGHPEWLDFPRDGNHSSFHYARRQYNLVADDLLRYKFLNAWDRAMHHLEGKHPWLTSPHTFVSLKHEEDKVIVFERGSLLFAFNFHPTKSFTDYRIGTLWAGKYRVCLDSDAQEFAGFGRVDHNTNFFTTPSAWHDRPHSMMVYLPSRTVLVWECVG